jgi:hypothetical protein
MTARCANGCAGVSDLFQLRTSAINRSFGLPTQWELMRT